MSKIVQIQCIFYECKYQKFENFSKTMVEHTGLTEHSTRILRVKHLCTLVFGFQKFFMQSLSAFYCFFGEKRRIASKTKRVSNVFKVLPVYFNMSLCVIFKIMRAFNRYTNWKMQIFDRHIVVLLLIPLMVVKWWTSTI